MLLLAGANDTSICCGVVALSMIIGAVLASRWSKSATQKQLAQHRAAKAAERARYNRIKIAEGQARGLSAMLCELCGGTGTWQGNPESAQDCPRCLGVGIVTSGELVGRRCPRCRQPIDEADAQYCPNCGLELTGV